MIPAPGGFGAGARSRLLPASVTLRYFGAAAVFHLLAWCVLLAHAGELAGFAGGPGPVLAALHFITLGVLAMSAVGASMQLLPIATRQPLRSVFAVKLAWWTLVPGVAAFALGALLGRLSLMGAGALAAATALLVYAVLLADNLVRARGMRVIVAHGWGALVALVLAVATGAELAGGYVHGFAFNRLALASAHFVLAAYGFMGLLALGLSYLLLPMFALCPAPAPRVGYTSLGLAAAALLLAVAGLARDTGAPVMALAAGLGLLAALAHVVAMERALRARLRAPLGPAFVLVRVSWMLLLASLALALLLQLGWEPPHANVLFGLLLVPGWLLGFTLAVSQRILPFLATVHAGGRGRRAPLVSAMTPERPLALHRVSHLCALAALLCGVALGAEWLVRLGAALGLMGALAYAAFFLEVLTRLRKYRSRQGGTNELQSAS